MQITSGKIVGLVVALGSVVAMVVSAGGATADVVKGCAVLLLPLALIWFPEEIGGFTGYVGRGGDIDSETPPILILFIGWLFLIGLPVLFYFTR